MSEFTTEKRTKAVKIDDSIAVIKIKDNTAEVFVRCTAKQAALLALVKGMQHGTITECVIKRGEPVVVKAATQRIDFERPDEIGSLFELLEEDIRNALPVSLDAK